MRLTSPVSYQTSIAHRSGQGAAATETSAAVREANGNNNTSDQRQANEQAVGETRLTAEEQAVVASLRSSDTDATVHDDAHAAGKLAGAATYHYRRGPDGRMYAVGGDVASRADVGADAANRAVHAEAPDVSTHHHHDGSECPICAARVSRYTSNLPSDSGSSQDR